MIMPISAVPTQAKSNFRGAIHVSAPFDEVFSKLTVMEQRRWGEVKTLAEKSNDGLLFQIYQSINKIGKTIIKSMVIKGNDGKILNEEVYNITRGGSLILAGRDQVVRTVFETFEKIYKK